MLVLVTGATGRIGRTVCRRLLGRGYTIRALVQPGDPRMSGLPDQIEARIGDLTAAKSLRSVVVGVDAVVHLAAVTSPGEGYPRQYFTSIAQGTFNLLEAIGTVHRFVFASSVSVYFAAPYHPPLFAPVTEDHPLRPVTPYGAAKLAAETMMFSCELSHGLAAVALRLTTTIDPIELISSDGVFAREAYLGAALRWHTRDGHPDSPAEQRFVDSLRRHRGENIVLVHTDRQGRSPIHSIAHPDDAAGAIVAALETPAATGGVFNIGPAGPHSQALLAKHLANRLGFRTAAVEPIEGKSRSWAVSIAKARAVLGYAPSHDVFSMVDEALASI